VVEDEPGQIAFEAIAAPQGIALRAQVHTLSQDDPVNRSAAADYPITGAVRRHDIKGLLLISQESLRSKRDDLALTAFNNRAKMIRPHIQRDAHVVEVGAAIVGSADPRTPPRRCAAPHPCRPCGLRLIS
jgi:hypothetical protein